MKTEFMDIRSASIAKALREKKADKPCERCNGLKFSVLQGFGRLISMKEEKKSGKLYETEYENRFAMLVCDNCGNVTLHNLKALGLWE